MTVFRAATVFSKNGPGDIVTEMNNSIAYLQAVYCFPDPCEYFESQTLISPYLNYLEIHVTYHDADNYKQWYDFFGEVLEELMAEMKSDLEPHGITITRYVENVEFSRIPSALDYSLFTSKLLDENGQPIKFK